MRREVFKLWCLTVDRVCTFHIQCLHTVDRLAYNVQHTTLNLVASGHDDRTTRWYYLKVTLQTIRIVHGHTTYSILSDVLLYLDNQILPISSFNTQSIVNLWQNLLRILALSIKVNIDNRTDNLGDAPINL